MMTERLERATKTTTNIVVVFDRSISCFAEEVLTLLSAPISFDARTAALNARTELTYIFIQYTIMHNEIDGFQDY